MLAFLPPFLMQVFEIPARFVLGMYLVSTTCCRSSSRARAAWRTARTSAASWPAGSVAWLMDRRGVAARPARLAARRSRAVAAPTPCGRRSRTAATTRRREAYFALPAPAPAGALAADEAVALATWLRQRTATPTPRSRCCGAWCATCRRGEGLAEVYALAGMILLEDRREPTAAYQYLLTALELGPRPETEAAVRTGSQRIEALQKRRVGRAATRLR